MKKSAKKSLILLTCAALLFSCKKEETLPAAEALSGAKLEVLSNTVVPVPTDAINVNKLGIVADGTTDVTSKIQTALSNNLTLFFPKGVYVISKTLNLKSGHTIVGEAGTVFKTKLSSFASVPFFYFLADTDTDVSAANIEFHGNSAILQPEVGVYFRNCTDAKVTNITTKYASVLNVSGGSTIAVDACNGYGKRISKWGDFGVMMSKANGWRITNSTFENYYQGIQWWGGDSHPEVDGAVGNDRLAKNGHVENNIVKNVIGGGIWGSMGENIYVKSNTVSGCDDVGIDFEGNINAKAQFNTVSNCKNGGLTTFYFGRGISFLDNTVTQPTSTYPLIRIYGDTDTQENQDVLFSGNKLSCSSGLGFINQYGPASAITFENNELNNVMINFTCKNNKNITIRNNRLNLSVMGKSNAGVIQVGKTRNNGVVTVEGNEIVSPIIQGSTVHGIHMIHDDSLSAPVNKLSYNKFVGFTKFYLSQWLGQNPNFVCSTRVYCTEALKRSQITRWDSAPTVAKFYVNDVEMSKY